MVAVKLEDTLVGGYRRLAAETPRRRIDIEIRVLDLLFATVFGAVLLPVGAVIALAILCSSGRPILYRGERVGRGARFFTMLKFRTLERDAESRLGPYLGEELVRRTQAEYTRVGPLAQGIAARRDPAALERPARRHVVRRPPPDQGAVLRRACGRAPGVLAAPGRPSRPDGFAQVRRGYETSMAEKLSHDLEWIADRSVRLYLRTLASTGIRVLGQTLRGGSGSA